MPNPLLRLGRLVVVWLHWELTVLGTGVRRKIIWGDKIFLGLTLATAVVLIGIFLALVVILAEGSWLSITTIGVGFVWGQLWEPGNAQVFGAMPFIAGTLITSLIGLLIAVPVSLGIAIFLSEQSPAWLREPLTYLVELLAAVPSIIYGLWGFFVLGPYLGANVYPQLQQLFPGNPLFAGAITGYGILTSGIILAIMIIPTISALSRESMGVVPQAQREAALSLGATKWESTRMGVLKYARSGIFGAVILGLGRAVGETMAVTMTIGNDDVIPKSLFSSGQSMASLLANEFQDPTSPLDKAALVEIALVLLVISLIINVGARLMMRRLVIRE